MRGVDLAAAFTAVFLATEMVLEIVAGKLVVEALGVASGVPPFFRGGRGGGTTGVRVNDSPVSCSQAQRIVNERHSIVRVTFAGRECHDNINVPVVIITLRPVIIWSGQTANNSHRGVMARARSPRVTSAGAVVAEVGVRPTERNVVNEYNGSKKIFNLAVNVCKVSNISSSDGCTSSFLNLLRNIPTANANTITTLPPYLTSTSPYSTTAQNAATSKKLSQGSPLVHVNKPMTLFPTVTYG